MATLRLPCEAVRSSLYLTAHARLFWRMQAAVSPMTGSSDNKSKVIDAKCCEKHHSSDYVQAMMSPKE